MCILIDIQKDEIGVEIHRQLNPATPHGGMGDAGMDTGDGHQIEQSAFPAKAF